MARASVAKRIRPNSDGLTVNVVPKRWVNRALIQNHEPIFDTFEVVKEKPGVARGVRVDVEIHTGAEPVSYSASFDLDEDVTDLSTTKCTGALIRSPYWLVENGWTTTSIGTSCRRSSNHTTRRYGW